MNTAEDEQLLYCYDSLRGRDAEILLFTLARIFISIVASPRVVLQCFHYALWLHRSREGVNNKQLMFHSTPSTSATHKIFNKFSLGTLLSLFVNFPAVTAEADKKG